MARLEGKIAIVTGAARGIGASIAERFVAEGAKVLLTDLREDLGNELAEKLGANAVFEKHDVSSEDEWETVIKVAEDTFGPVNILVNNAGIGAPMKTIEETTEEGFQQVIDVNQKSVFLGMKAVLPSMKKTEKSSIVNVSSLAGLVGMRNQSPYIASKFAVRGLTKAAAMEFVDYDIRVNSIHPGSIITPIMDGYTEDDFKAASKIIPMGRFAESEEVANLALYLASDESSYSTGAEFVVDGGASSQ